MTTPPPSANTLDLRPLMFETFVGAIRDLLDSL